MGDDIRKSDPNPSASDEVPQAGGASPDVPGDDDDDDDDDDDGYAGLSKSELLAQIRRKDRRNLKLLRRAKDAETKASDVEKELQELSTRDLPDAEKARKQIPLLEKRVSDLESENNQLRESLRGERLERQVEKIAGAIGFRDAEDALAYLPLDDLDVDEDTGEIDRTSVERALKSVAKAKPYLLLPEKGGDGNGGKPPKDVPASPTPSGEGRTAEKDAEVRRGQHKRFARRI